METLYIVLIIVVVFIALLAAAIIGHVVVRNNRKLNKRKRLQQPPVPPIPDIVNFTSPGIVPATAPEAIKSPANSIVAPVTPDGQTVRMRNTDDLNKYYVAGSDPFVQLFNDTLKKC